MKCALPAFPLFPLSDGDHCCHVQQAALRQFTIGHLGYRILRALCMETRGRLLLAEVELIHAVNHYNYRREWCQAMFPTIAAVAELRRHKNVLRQFISAGHIEQAMNQFVRTGHKLNDINNVAHIVNAFRPRIVQVTTFHFPGHSADLVLRRRIFGALELHIDSLPTEDQLQDELARSREVVKHAFERVEVAAVGFRLCVRQLVQLKRLGKRVFSEIASIISLQLSNF